MKLYTFYTDSHKNILEDWFIPTFKNTQDGIELIIKKFDQKCNTGKYIVTGKQIGRAHV